MGGRRKVWTLLPHIELAFPFINHTGKGCRTRYKSDWQVLVSAPVHDFENPT
jgi:hypothetical protein